MMLETQHRLLGRNLPVYGMNCGSVGFLMNDFREDALPERLAAAQAAGWMLTAPMRATAARLRNVCGAEPDPAAVAAAVAALGGCPAAVAALSAKGVA
jgi:hypothetical protein